jgi:hypothetical protein
MEIYKAISAIMKEVDAIGKNKTNQTQNFKYRGIDDFYNELSPLMAKYGVFSIPKVIEHSSETRKSKTGGDLNYRFVLVEFTFAASDGSSIVAAVTGEAMDSGDKGFNKALAVAHKYALMQVFAVPTEDTKDPDELSHETVTIKPATATAVKPVEQKPVEKIKPMSERILDASKATGWVKEDLQNYQKARWAVSKFSALQPKEQEIFLDTVQKFTFNQAMDAVRILTQTPFEAGDDKL